MRSPLLALALFLIPACGGKDDTDPGQDDTDSSQPDDTDTDDTGDDTQDSGDPDDADGDGFASLEAGGEDCDDGDAAIHPDADELCDEVDNDCDGLVDDEDDAVVSAPSWYGDVDADGYGAGAPLTQACTAPEGATDNDQDCDDDDDGVNPGAEEICDGVDNDCDPATDEAGTASLQDGRSFTTLQDAVNASASGWTVSVCEGTWAESISIDHDLTIVGLAGAEATIIDAGSPTAFTSTVSVQRGHVILEDLTITGGTGTSNDGNTWGGGIYAAGADDLELRDCIVEGNQADFGGGMAGPSGYPATATLIDSLFQSNEAFFAGGGFLLFHGGLEGTEVTDNSAPYGGGGAVFYWDVTADSTSVIHGNHATESGGGLMIWDEGQWSGGAVTANSSDGSGGGVFVTDISTIEDVEISDNEASREGGGLALDDARVTMTSVQITGNTASTGGGAWMTGSDLTCTGCDFGEAATDNDPDDLVLDSRPSSVSYEIGSAASFTCSTTAGGCEGI